MKNDLLRKRFDGLKYDLKKIEEGLQQSHHYTALTLTIVISRVRCLPAEARQSEDGQGQFLKKA
jgi:hypothetical protein